MIRAASQDASAVWRECDGGDRSCGNRQYLELSVVEEWAAEQTPRGRAIKRSCVQHSAAQEDAPPVRRERDRRRPRAGDQMSIDDRRACRGVNKLQGLTETAADQNMPSIRRECARLDWHPALDFVDH